MADLSSPVGPHVTAVAIRMPGWLTGDRLAWIQYAVVMALLAYAIYAGGSAMPYDWQWARVPQFLFVVDDNGFRWGPLALGAAETVRISALALVIALPWGLAPALARFSSSWSAWAIAIMRSSRSFARPLSPGQHVLLRARADFRHRPFWTGVITPCSGGVPRRDLFRRAGRAAQPVRGHQPGSPCRSLPLRRAARRCARRHSPAAISSSGLRHR